MRNCGRGFTAAVTESSSPQSWLFCIGKFADYKRRSAGRLRGKFHLTVGRRLTKPAVLLFSVLTARKMCGYAAPSRLGADCHIRLYVGKLLFVALTVSLFYTVLTFSISIPLCSCRTGTYFLLRQKVCKETLSEEGKH